jgi:hypothetical protein
MSAKHQYWFHFVALVVKITRPRQRAKKWYFQLITTQPAPVRFCIQHSVFSQTHQSCCLQNLGCPYVPVSVWPQMSLLGLLVSRKKQCPWWLGIPYNQMACFCIWALQLTFDKLLSSLVLSSCVSSVRWRFWSTKVGGQEQVVNEAYSKSQPSLSVQQGQWVFRLQRVSGIELNT